MAEITGARQNIQTEDVQFRASVSEAVGSKLGGSINFINNRQYDTHQFNFNGRYALGVGVLGADGVFPILFDMEITGLTLYNRVSGSSGTTQVDLQWFSASNVNEGTIFSTKPSLDSSSTDNSYIIRNEITSTDLELPTGGVSPVFSKTQFDAGDAVLCLIDSAMTDAEDLAVMIHFRPR